MKIYADILIIVNCILTMIYLQTMSIFTHRRLTQGRLAVASLLGGLSAMLIAADGSSFAGAVWITAAKWLLTAATLLIAFRFDSILGFFRTFAGYIGVIAAYTGMILLYWQLSDSKRIYVRNYTIYFDISLMKLTAAVITAYGILTAYERISRRIRYKNGGFKAIYRNGDYELRLPAVADTGNKLCDAFTGLPIIIFCCDEMYEHYGLDDKETGIRMGFRLTPYNTLSGPGLMAVTPKGTVKLTDDNGMEKEVRCMVGITCSNGSSRAIFDPAVLD